MRLQIAANNWKILLSKKILCKASKNKCMVGKFFRNFHVPNKWRERLSFGTVHVGIL